jgi:hypothetical protein
MHYSPGHIERFDRAAATAKLDERVKKLKSAIAQGDQEAVRLDNYPYSFEARLKQLEWRQYKRPVHARELANLERDRQLCQPDTDWRPTTGAFFYGSDK